MRAAIFDSPEEAMDVRSDVKLAEPSAGQVKVRIKAAGVCHSDLHIRNGDWDSETPMVLGHEGAGVVTEVGPGVEKVKVGDHVVLSWVAPCGKCAGCLAGQPTRCEVLAETVAVLGVLGDGSTALSMSDGSSIKHYLGIASFAQDVVVMESAAIAVREDIPFDRAALLSCGVPTGVGAAQKTVSIGPEDSVLVIGCGTVGLSVIQGARMSGSKRIIAVDRVREKLDVAKAVGATDVILADGRDVLAAVREIVPDGVNYAFDAIGLPIATEQSIESLANDGTAVIVGMAPQEARASFNLLRFGETSQRLIGCNMGEIVPATDIPRLADLYMEGELRLDEMVGETVALDEINGVFESLERGELLKAIIDPWLGTDSPGGEPEAP